MTEMEPEEVLDLDRQSMLQMAGLCWVCETSVSDKQPGEGTTNGAHNYCLLQNSSGHLVGACWCNPETKDMSTREIAVMAYNRLKEQYGE